jgi:hypothetical protein
MAIWATARFQSVEKLFVINNYVIPAKQVVAE